MVQLAKKVGAPELLTPRCMFYWMLGCWKVFLFLQSCRIRFVLQFGSAVKLPGSGGAVVGLCLDNTKLVRSRHVVINVIGSVGTELHIHVLPSSWLPQILLIDIFLYGTSGQK